MQPDKLTHLPTKALTPDYPVRFLPAFRSIRNSPHLTREALQLTHLKAPALPAHGPINSPYHIPI
uniref:Uncharacterized protein n=1 Tax=Picea glauca TaxID=3330 RepID=A0A101M0K1_PICGL|nr:hypothetical protein ABT39_MTgene4703 [Picea glauca]QHR90950.1 hypothetical protein Q903MT_gene4979 [Picea sitchensis]